MMKWYVFGAELGWQGMYLIMLLLSIIPMIPTVFAKIPKNEVAVEDRVSIKSFFKDPAAWMIVSILSFGVVAEMAFGGWLVNFLEKAYDWSTTSASTMLSVFFLCFMLARLLLGPVTDRIGFTKSLIVFSGLAGISTLLAVFSGETGVFLFALAGIGVAPIYPTVMALLAKRYPNGTETAITFTVTLLGIALVIGNFLIGFIVELSKQWFSQLYGSDVGLIRGLQSGFIFIGLCAVICSLSSIVLYRYLHKKQKLL